MSHGASIARLVQPTKICRDKSVVGPINFPTRFVHIKKGYVFQLLHFLISIDEFLVSVILLRYFLSCRIMRR
jgi:hypothetical protein